MGRKMIRNLLSTIAEKNMTLSRKIRSTSGKTIRARLYTFFKEESLLRDAKEFDIPFDRQSLSEYLNCDRSQLSKELSKMKKEGLIEINKKRVRIL